ncbi:MAG: ACT domain-containing protein [Ruminococcaceae bacterium]|nr:ACT domain-containing protein [Oscillospiraceae bacterium]
MRAVLTVIGTDKVGIIAKVSAKLAELDINILDISQTIMQNIFTMIMLVDTEKSKKGIDEISKSLSEVGQEIGVEIRLQHEGIFNSMHRI